MGQQPQLNLCLLGGREALVQQDGQVHVAERVSRASAVRAEQIRQLHLGLLCHEPGQGLDQCFDFHAKHPFSACAIGRRYCRYYTTIAGK